MTISWEVGSVIIAAVTVAGALAAAYNAMTRDRRTLREYRRRILNAGSGSEASGVLLEMYGFLSSADRLLRSRPRVQEFFDKWVDDQILKVTGKHAGLMLLTEGSANLAELKNDAQELLD